MGNTYGSIHVKTTQGEQLVQMILEKYRNQPSEFERVYAIFQERNIYTNPEFLRIWKRESELQQDQFIMVATGEWVSVYDEQLSFEEVVKKARSLAKKTQEPVVYMSCFDGDVYVFGLIEDGKTKTSGRAVVDPDVYAMTEKQAKMADIYRVAGIPMPDKKMKMPSDVMELEELLMSIMPVPLIVYDEDDFKMLAEEYELVEEVRGIRVFRVKYKK